MARIVTVYSTERKVELNEMANIRWQQISLALARRGHDVDMATAEHKWRLRRPVVQVDERVRRVPISQVSWDDYHVVKTLFHLGFETLERFDGVTHPFIISKLGSVVGARDLDGIYFYGEQRERLYETQVRIARRSRFVTLLTEPARQLWIDCFGHRPELLLVPGAAPTDVPAPGADPFPQKTALRCLFAGNFYEETERSQPEAHRTLVGKLNELGRLLSQEGARLYVLGTGTARNLDAQYVTYLGTATYDESWNYLQHADVGVVVAAGPFNHNNESTKIYHYLRVGLPVVSEAGFPNDDVVRQSGLGSVVPSGDMRRLADAVLAAGRSSWDREAAVQYILKHHTWDARAEVYDHVIRDEL
jgi:hypothetical protein